MYHNTHTHNHTRLGGGPGGGGQTTMASGMGVQTRGLAPANPIKPVSQSSAPKGLSVQSRPKQQQQGVLQRGSQPKPQQQQQPAQSTQPQQQSILRSREISLSYDIPGFETTYEDYQGVVSIPYDPLGETKSMMMTNLSVQKEIYDELYQNGEDPLHDVDFGIVNRREHQQEEFDLDDLGF